MKEAIAEKRVSSLTAFIVAICAVLLSVISVAYIDPFARVVTLAAILALAGIAGYIYFVSRHPIVGIYVIILMLPLDVLGRLSENTPITLFQIALVLTLISWLISLAGKKEIVFARSPIDLLILALIASIALSFPMSFSRGETILALVRVAALFAFFLLITNTVRSQSSLKKVLIWIVITGIFFSVFAMAQFFIPGFRFGTVSNISSLGVKRVGGFFHDPNFFASFLSVAFLISFALWIKARFREKLYLSIPTIFLSVSLLLTFSRTAWIGTLGGLLAVFLLFKDERLQKFLVVALIIVFIVLAIPGPIQGRVLSIFDLTKDASARARFNLVISTLEMIRDHPIFGVGVGAFSYAYPRYRVLGVRDTLVKPHQLPLTMWAEAGILGIATLLYLLYVWLRLWKGKRNILEVASASAVVSLMVQNLFYYFLYNDYLWLMLALSMSAYGLNLTNRKERGIGRVQD